MFFGILPKYLEIRCRDERKHELLYITPLFVIDLMVYYTEERSLYVYKSISLYIYVKWI